MQHAKRWSWSGWAAIAALCVVYGPMAVEYTWRLFHPDAPALWDHTYATVVDHDEAYGAGSIHTEQPETYAENRVTLLFHTTAGGIAILIFAAQFSARFRRNLRRHRVLGRVGVGLALTGMAGAAVYLLAAGPQDTFDGPAFYIQLWALAIGTTAGTALGFAAAVKRQIAMHQALMAYAFALLLTAPLLRVFYLVLGNLWPESNQLETNLAGGAILATWAPLGAIIASRTMAPGDRFGRGIEPLRLRAVTGVVLMVSAAGAALLVWRYAEELGAPDRVTLSGLIAALTGLAVAATNAAAARRAGRARAAEEWRLHTIAAIATFPTALVLWFLYDLPFATDEAFFGALLTAAPLPLSATFAIAVWRRRVLRGAKPAASSEDRSAAPAAAALAD